MTMACPTTPGVWYLWPENVILGVRVKSWACCSCRQPKRRAFRTLVRASAAETYVEDNEFRIEKVWQPVQSYMSTT